MDGTQLRVGDGARRQAGTAIALSLGAAAAYCAFTWVTKETPALYLHQPWQDDPYDALVSFDFVGLPLLVAAGAARVRLCRRFQPLPYRRVVDLLRLCRVVVGLALATQAAEWIATVLRARARTWNAVTAWQLVALAALTLATLAAGWLLHRTSRGIASAARPASQPDWLADAVALLAYEARRLPAARSLTEPVLSWVDTQVVARVRARPVGAAALLAALLTLPEVAAKIWLEHYPASLVLYVSVVSTAGLFGFAVAAGSYLRVVAPRGDRAPAWVGAAVAASIGASLAVAFRDPLLASVGIDPDRATVETLAVLTVCAAAVAALLAQSVRRMLNWG